jgi:hypothetical protein
MIKKEFTIYDLAVASRSSFIVHHTFFGMFEIKLCKNKSLLIKRVLSKR